MIMRYDGSNMHSSERTHHPDKPCVMCGRPIAWRKKWARCWDEIRVCSGACRAERKRSDANAASIEGTIIALLRERDGDATICPSEVARAMFPDDWRTRMEAVRRVARKMEGKGTVVGKQGGKRVDLATVRGAIRIGRGQTFGGD